MKIKKGDKIKILSGKDKGKESVVSRVITKNGKIVADGINIVKKHVKAGVNRKAEIITIEKPIFVSIAMVICGKCNKTTRVSYKFIDNKKLRICKKCTEVL